MALVRNVELKLLMKCFQVLKDYKLYRIFYEAQKYTRENNTLFRDTHMEKVL